MSINGLLKYETFQQIKRIGILVFPVVLYLIPVAWFTGPHTICLFKNIFGHECFGCGITRAIISALHFDFTTAFSYNKLVVVVLPLLVYVWIKTVLKLWIKKSITI
jgi:hypothetical protein